VNRREFFSWFCGLASLPVVGRLFERCPTGSKVQAMYLNRLWVGGEMEPGPRTIKWSDSFDEWDVQHAEHLRKHKEFEQMVTKEIRVVSSEDAKPRRVKIGGYDENGVYREETYSFSNQGNFGPSIDALREQMQAQGLGSDLAGLLGGKW